MSVAPNPNVKATSILMVEDEEHLRQMSAAILERAGFMVHQAGAPVRRVLRKGHLATGFRHLQGGI